MANVLKALTQRFQRHQLNDSPNQVKVSVRLCECFSAFQRLLMAVNVVTSQVFTTKLLLK